MDMFAYRGFEASSVIKDVSTDEVWDRIETWDGVNYELGPWVHMSFPPDFARVTDIPADGQCHFVSTMSFFDFLPFDLHRVTFVGMEKGSFFDERSSNFMMKVWTHIRTLEKVGDGVCVTDRCTIEARLPLTGSLVAFLYRQTFKRRHRRLVRYFAERSK